jgi:hypothetical protein
VGRSAGGNRPAGAGLQPERDAVAEGVRTSQRPCRIGIDRARERPSRIGIVRARERTGRIRLERACKRAGGIRRNRIISARQRPGSLP